MNNRIHLNRIAIVFWLLIAAIWISGCATGKDQQKIVVLTFDDNTRSQLEIVAPILKKKGFGATFFVSHAWMGDTVNFLDWKDIAALYNMGFEIGNHSWNHLQMATGDAIATMEPDLAKVDSALLANGVPRPVSFGYPGNHFAPGTVEKIRALDYRFARRGMQPEEPNPLSASGPLFDPEKNHRLLVPSTAVASPAWTLDYFKSVVDNAQKGKALILQFHGVPDPAHPFVSMDPALFAQCMDYLEQEGAKVIALKDLDKYFKIKEVEDPVLQYTIGVPGLFNPCPVEADVWVLAGQSNMQGAGRTPDTLTDPKIWMLNMDDRWMVAREPIHRIFEANAPAYPIASFELSGEPDKSLEKTRRFFQEQSIQSRQKPIGGTGPGIYFARHLAEATGKNIGLIPCALGGSKIDQWDPAGKRHGDSTLYGAMLQRVRLAGFENIRGLVWYQGESEALMGQAETYEAKLFNLIESFRRDIGRPDLPVLIVQIGRFLIRDPAGDFNWEALRNVQLKVASDHPGIFITNGIDLELDDVIHLSSRGQQRLGARLAELALTRVYGLQGHGDQIEPQSLELKKDTVTNSYYLLLHYQGVTGNLKADGMPAGFELRFGNSIRLSHVIPKVELDPDDAAGLRLYLSALPEEPASLVCGPGTSPVMNITDSHDMPVPAFGPLLVDFEALKTMKHILK